MEAEAVWDAAIEESTPEPDAVRSSGRAYHVSADAVAVVVAEVVGLPGQRREHDRHALRPDAPRCDDERGEAKAAVGRVGGATK